MSAKTVPRISKEEVAKHNTSNDLWLMVDGKAYDVTKFQKLHPGGAQLLQLYGGKDCTDDFYALHRHDIMEKYGPKLLKGIVEDPKMERPLISPVPYAEGSYFRPHWKSPFITETHKAFQTAVRKFIRENLAEDAEEAEDTEDFPTLEHYQAMGKFGLLASRIGVLCMPTVPHLGITLPGGVAPEKFDYFHEMMAHFETGRMGTPGFVDGIGAGFCIGLPPVLLFGQNDIRMSVGREVLLGNKRICLAVSEPQAGSDVANIQTTATKSPCGKCYTLSGVKKWITNGCFAEYFVTAARTGDKKGQMSLFLVERCEGLTTKQIKTSYSGSAGTALVIYDNVKVPAAHLLGEEHKGFQCVMANFNHERWFICCAFLGCLRLITQDCFLWIQQRKAFGKPLSAQPVVRFKMARIIAAVEGIQAYLESITYQMNSMDYKTQTKELAGPIGLLKYQFTRVGEMVSDEAVQMFGGRAITKTGMGKNIERFQRTFKFAAILGGSEEIMADLGVRQALRTWPRQAKL